MIDFTEKIRWPGLGDKLISHGPHQLENAWLTKGCWSTYAEGYYRLADLGCHSVIDDRTSAPMDVLIFPIVFNYRQFLECQLKDMSQVARFFDPELKVALSHKLLDKWRPLRKLIEDMWPTEDRAPVEAVESVLKEFERVDPTSEQFRYPFLRDGSTSLHDHTLINIRNLHDTMEGVYNFLGGVHSSMLEAKRTIEYAKTLLAEAASTPKLVTWNLTTDIGMTCGGEVTFLFETHNPKRWKIALFGAGHVAQAVAQTLINLDCHVTCLDARAEWIDRLPTSRKLKKVLSKDLPSEVSSFDADTFYVVMTQGHASDLPVLEKIFQQHPAAPYVGVMGSDVKARKIRHDLLERGIAGGIVDRLHSPIGLRLGGNQPYEIAISVVAELLQIRGDVGDAKVTAVAECPASAESI